MLKQPYIYNFYQLKSASKLATKKIKLLQQTNKNYIIEIIMLQKILANNYHHGTFLLLNKHIAILHHNLQIITQLQQTPTTNEVTKALTDMMTNMEQVEKGMFVLKLITEINAFYQQDNRSKLLSFEDQYFYFYETFVLKDTNTAISFFVNNCCETNNLDAQYYNFLAPANKTILDESFAQWTPAPANSNISDNLPSARTALTLAAQASRRDNNIGNPWGSPHTINEVNTPTTSKNEEQEIKIPSLVAKSKEKEQQNESKEEPRTQQTPLKKNFFLPLFIIFKIN